MLWRAPQSVGVCSSRCTQQVKNQSQTTWNSRYSGNRQLTFQSYCTLEQQGQAILMRAIRGACPSMLQIDHLISNQTCYSYSRRVLLRGVNCGPYLLKKMQQDMELIAKQNMRPRMQVCRTEIRYSSRSSWPVMEGLPRSMDGWVQ